MKKFSTKLFAFLFTCLSVAQLAQAGTVANVTFNDVTDLSQANLNLCGKPDTVTLYIGNKTGFVGPLTNVVIDAALGVGMSYVPGTAFVTTTITGTSSSQALTENASNVQDPKFTLTAGLNNGISRYIRFLVQGDCNVINTIANPIYCTYQVTYKEGVNTFINFDSTQQAYNNAFRITNIPQPTWQFNQSQTLYNGQTGCRQYWFQNTSATKGSVNYIKLYDSHTVGLELVTIGIARTSGGAPTYLTVTNNGGGDSSFAYIDSTKLIAAGFGDSLGPGQRIYVTECVRVTNTCSPGTWYSNVGLQWGFCTGGPCQDEVLTGGSVQIQIAGPTIGAGLSGSSVNTKCYATNNDDQIFYISNTGNGPGNNLTFNVNFDLSTYSEILTGSFFYDTTGTGTNWVAFTPSITTDNTYPNVTTCLGHNPKKFAAGTIPISALYPGATVLVKFKMHSCVPTNCGLASFGGWNFTGAYTTFCNPSPTGFSGNGLPTSNVDMTAKYAGIFSYAASTNYNIPWNIASTTYDNWSPDANAQWEFKVTKSSFFTFFNNPGDVVLKDVSGTLTWNPSSVTVVGNTITAKFDVSAMPSGWTFKNAKFYTKLKSVPCTAAPCASTVDDTLNWTALYIPDQTCATPAQIPVECIATRIRIAKFCTGGGVCQCPLDSFSFNRISLGLPDNANNGTANGASFTGPIATDRGMYKDTFEAYYHITSYTKSNNSNLLLQLNIDNAYYLSNGLPNGGYLDGTVTIKRGASTYSCTLPVPGSVNTASSTYI